MHFLNFYRKAQSILIFKKWGRRNFSLFTTLNKEVRIAVLSITYLVAAPVLSLAMSQDTAEVKMQYDLDEIEVSAQRSPVLFSQVARIISVFERKEIEASPAQSVQELLEYVAGVDVRQRGAEGVQADVSIRGGTFDQTLILLNGINITDPQTGHHNLNLPVSLNQVERIEILEGPAARVYGPNAFSGAINIITRQSAGTAVELDVAAGSFGYLNGGIQGSFKILGMQHLLAVNGKSSDGYIDNTDFKAGDLFYSGWLGSAKGDLRIQAGLSGKEFGANSFYTPRFPNQFEETGTLFSSARWESSGKFHFTPSIYWRRHQDRFELFRSDPPSWYKNHNHHLTNTYGINGNSWFQWEWGKTAFGLEYRSENILSNVLGETMKDPVKVPGEDALFTKSKSRDMFSGFLEHSYYGDRWIISGGIMGNYITTGNTGWNFFPGIDASYEVAMGMKAFASFNTSLRMPTFTDLYYSGPTNIGNPDLKPERSMTWEGGLKWNQDLIKGHFVLFYRQGKDIIDWVKVAQDSLWQPRNLTRLNSMGTEIQVQTYPKQILGAGLPDQVLISYLYNQLQKEEMPFISNYVLDNLKHKLTCTISYRLVKNLSADFRINYQDRAGTYTQYTDGAWGNEVEYKPFWLFSGKLRYQMQNWGLFVSASNIFNTTYHDIGNVVQPGRWVKTGITYRLGFE